MAPADSVLPPALPPPLTHHPLILESPALTGESAPAQGVLLPGTLLSELCPARFLCFCFGLFQREELTWAAEGQSLLWSLPLSLQPDLSQDA